MKESSISEWSRSKSKGSASKGSKLGEIGKSQSDIKPKMESKVIVKTEKSTEGSVRESSKSNFKELFINQDIKLSALDNTIKPQFQIPVVPFPMATNHSILDHSLLQPSPNAAAFHHFVKAPK